MRAGILDVRASDLPQAVGDASMVARAAFAAYRRLPVVTGPVPTGTPKPISTMPAPPSPTPPSSRGLFIAPQGGPSGTPFSLAIQHGLTGDHDRRRPHTGKMALQSVELVCPADNHRTHGRGDWLRRHVLKLEIAT